LVRFFWEVPKTGQSAPNEIGNSPRSATTNNQQQPANHNQQEPTTNNKCDFQLAYPVVWSPTRHFFAGFFTPNKIHLASHTKTPSFGNNAKLKSC